MACLRGTAKRPSSVTRNGITVVLRIIVLDSFPLSSTAKLWARVRNAGTLTSDNEALDIDVILAAQILSLEIPESQFVIVTTNVRRLSHFAPADLWTKISP